MLRSMVEKRFSHPFSDEEYAEAESYASMKLDFQSRLFGKTFDDDYRAQVIAEIINQNRLDALYQERQEIRDEFIRRIEEEKADRTEKWVEKTALALGITRAAVRGVMELYLSAHIVPQSDALCNMEG